MNLETFFEKFDLFADCPNAVQKMRELILELAVQGKLVEQREEEGRAPSDRMLADGLDSVCKRIGITKSKATICHVEGSFELPASWRWVSLESIGIGQTGGTPSKELRTNSEGSIPFIKPADIESGIVLDGSDLLTQAAAENGCRIVPAGSVLMVCIGTIGKCGVVEYECAFNQQINALTPSDLVIGGYVRCVLMSPFFQMAAWAESSRTTIAILNKGKWLKLPFPLPPLAEQKRIVAKVDELMALCDALEAQQKERETKRTALAKASLSAFAEAPSPQSLELLFHPSYAIDPAELRKSILTLAVQGKLVEQREEDGGACGFKVLGKGKELAQIEPNELPFDLPKNWKWCRLGWVAELLNGDRGKNYPNREEYVQSGVPWINTGHIEPDGSLSLETMNYLTREKYNSLRSGKISKGDLVYCLRGATLGKTAIIEQFEEGAVASSLVILRLVSSVYSRYAYFYLTSPVGRELICRFDNGSAQPNLSANSVKLYVFPLPPLAEQKRIVAKVDELMALVDRLEALGTAARETASRLLEAMVAELSGRAAA